MAMDASGLEFGAVEEVAHTVIPIVPSAEASERPARHCGNFLERLRLKLDKLREGFGADHLLVVARNGGAIAYAALSYATDLSIGLFGFEPDGRMQYLGGVLPAENSRVVVVLDFAPHEQDLVRIQSSVMQLAGATVVGAVTFASGPEVPSVGEVAAQAGLRIAVLSWPKLAPPSVGSDEARDVPGSREEPSEAWAMKAKIREGGVPAGVYTTETLPQLSSDAMAMVREIEASARQRRVERGEPAELDVARLKSDPRRLDIGGPRAKVVDFSQARPEK